MKILCIKEQFNNNFNIPHRFPFTVGKIYNVTEVIGPTWGLAGSYFAICDTGKESVAYKECFILLDEHRQQQLEKLGI